MEGSRLNRLLAACIFASILAGAGFLPQRLWADASVADLVSPPADSPVYSSHVEFEWHLKSAASKVTLAVEDLRTHFVKKYPAAGQKLTVEMPAGPYRWQVVISDTVTSEWQLFEVMEMERAAPAKTAEAPVATSPAVTAPAPESQSPTTLVKPTATSAPLPQQQMRNQPEPDPEAAAAPPAPRAVKLVQQSSKAKLKKPKKKKPAASERLPASETVPDDDGLKWSDEH